MGFTREQRRQYNRLKRTGLTDKAIAESWGLSPSTLSRVKNSERRFSNKSSEKIDNRNINADVEEVEGFWRGESQYDESDITKISFQELERLSESDRPRTARLAQDALSDIERENPDLSVAELRELVFDRPQFQRSITGVDGKRGTINLYLGASKRDEAIRGAKKQLRKKGIRVNKTYTDFGGYTGVRAR